MRILADQNIPGVADAFRELGEVSVMPGRDIKAQHLRDCQCLIVRTVTRVDAALLDNSAVEFVGSATIGTDHIDLDYLQRAGINCSNAAGCNAEAAAEYVISGLFAMSVARGFDPLRLKAGIVGYGNVGSRLHSKLSSLGIDCLICDPPLQQRNPSAQAFVDLDTLLGECGLISLHVPLTRTGEHPSFQLLNHRRLQQLGEGCVLINAARGEVVDNRALHELLQQRADLRVFLDTWENEPAPLRPLLQRVDLATPHIAGYSVEGRLRGTQMVLDAACAKFGLASSWQLSAQLPAAQLIDCRPFGIGLEFWQALFRRHCNIDRDHRALLTGACLEAGEYASHFDGLRRVYMDRLEYPRFCLRIDRKRQPVQQLQELGFELLP